jgi:tetratricopeptide (TPR) repeat protein
MEFETAIALDRNNAWAIFQLGQTLMWLGQPEAGIPHIVKSIRLDPRYPNMAIRYFGLGACHLLLGHVDEAIDLLSKARPETLGSITFIFSWQGHSASRAISTRREPNSPIRSNSIRRIIRWHTSVP